MKKGYAVEPRHCRGCRYACFISGTPIYVCCAIYLDTGGTLSPLPLEGGGCGNRTPGGRLRISPMPGIWKKEGRHGTA